MAVCFCFFLIVFGLKGVYSVSVSKVSVKAGDSITVPCTYDARYRNNVKYLCKGSIWSSCSYAVKTNQPDGSGKFAISDDKTKNIFTVTINDLTVDDAGYWCVVEIDRGADDSWRFQLSVTRGSPRLHVDQQNIRGFNGENITIQVNSSNSGGIKWCRLGRSCVTGPSGLLDNTRVTIDEKAHDVFTVTMSRLMMQSSGWYVFVRGDLQMPVHLTVMEKPSTTTTEQSGDKAVQNGQPSTTVDLKILIIPLTLLILIVMVSVGIWFIMRHSKSEYQGKGKSSAAVVAEEGIIYCDVTQKSKMSQQATSSGQTTPGDDVIYGNIRNTSTLMSCPDVDVLYSSVVI